MLLPTSEEESTWIWAMFLVLPAGEFGISFGKLSQVLAISREEACVEKAVRVIRIQENGPRLDDSVYTRSADECYAHSWL